MKKVLMIVAMTMAVVGAKAQYKVGTWSVQPKIGVGAATLTNMDKLPIGNRDLDTEPAVAALFGADFEYQLAPWLGLSAGLNYSLQGTAWEDYKDGNDRLKDPKFELGYINIPLVANFYVAKGLALKTGVQVGFLTNADFKFRVEDQDFAAMDVEVDADYSADMKRYFKKVDVSIPVGISYEFPKHFVLDARYNIGLTKVNKYSVPGEDDNYNGVFMVTFGYKFRLN